MCKINAMTTRSIDGMIEALSGSAHLLQSLSNIV
uniref:Uncharacterized protein n=1 Tax=viral metagenome TaxID=1070528 RepID=A0A6C0BLX9_9ZZZZ